MYISNLHIQGFKSFLNKTDLQFGEGITSIVGPNGCGKSNIVDAIRWILGEQKTTVLRSQKMEDVIFKGAKNYKPLGFCEVSLIINNDKGRLPLEYTEIEIMRRFYRSGESEYLLNKVPCRLKDITGLFMDSGLSPNAYSVIELKMIDSIISHNPEERKKLFEEAAGINYYKQQRHTTFRKLEAARIDLDRVADIILEVENSVNALRLQLKRFERHKKLSDKLLSSEILLAQAEIQLLDMEAAPLEAKVSERRSRQTALSGQVNLDEELIAETQGKFEAAKVELENYSQSVDALEKKLGEINNNLLIWTEQKKAGELRIKQYADESVQAKTRIETIQRQIEELNLEITALKPNIEAQKEAFRKKSQEFDAVAARYREVENQYSTLRKKLEKQLERVYQAESGFHKTRVEIEEKRHLIERLQEQKKGFLERLSAQQFEADELQGKLNQIEKINSGLSLEIENLQDEQAKAEELLIREKEVFSKTQSGLSALKARHQFYQKIISAHEGKPSGTKYILTHQDDFKGIIGCVSDLISVEESHRIAVETALGEALNYLVVDTTENALQNLSLLKQKTDFSISFVALDLLEQKLKLGQEEKLPGKNILSLIKYNPSLATLFAVLLGDVRLVETSERLSNLTPEYRSRYNWVTDAGDYLGRSTVIKYGGKSKESLIGRRDQLSKLEIEMESTADKLEQIKKNIQNYKTQADAVCTSLKQKIKHLDESVSDSVQLEKKLAQHRYSCQHQKERLNENDEVIAENIKAVKVLGIRQTKLDEALNELKTEYKSIQAEIADMSVTLETINKERNKKQQGKQDSRVKLVEIEKEFEGLEYRLEASTSQLVELDNRKKQIMSASERLGEKVLKLEQSIAENSAVKEELIRKQNILVDKKRSIQDTYNGLYEQMQDLQRNVRDRQKVKEENIQQIRQAELKLTELTREKELIRNKIREVYHQEVPKRILDLNEINIDELRDSIAAIDRSINRIGPINMAVAEEYKAESERYEFLKKQFDDLQESEQNLKQSIEKIDTEARKKFSKTFEQVAENFKKTYKLFFDGGEAHVRLVGSEDPLEAEIEIIARPPGKRTQTIRMLSAGEKALTAISLLFAIYLVKPSPFCILDEVDAPLDDSNITRFTKVLRQFSENTQFIVITHNKLTMEEADYLYGVTQEEEGVSKIVSVKFKNEGQPLPAATSDIPGN